MPGGNPLSMGRDVAVDLGTANTLVYVKGQGLVLNEPSMVAVDTRSGQVVAVGHEAKRMWGRAPRNIRLVRPLKDGVIADFDVCEQMLKQFLQRVSTSRWSKPRVIVAVPSEVTGVERRAVQDAAEFAGARRPVYIIEEAMAAAIGAGLPVHEPSANLIVDIGGGTTEVAVISLGGIVTANSVRVGGDELNEVIIAMFKRDFDLDIGVNTAEEVKIQLGSAWPLQNEVVGDVGGRDTKTGLPRTQEVTTQQVREALDEAVMKIVDAIKRTLERTPPELAADVISHGLVLAGGGALLAGLAERITHETGIQAFIAPEPLLAVVLGAGMTLENLEAIKGLTIQSEFS
ncbi:MAG: rod shape-determining protein [Ilumatobacteraceae bacterium]|jgi:rod shape-determining protein MreB and related proteins|nr:rod shape-determining protein [Actinomycetota bacterium]MDP4736454.1 rod shape-determining protein [Ilumatobacteraceae bacterium]MDP4850711.1 rod shape-determining protein [Ilumatobacteraceae bacterium]MDP4902995.1 rod shape-determining protein [Ilumatobacteraceae bacterium]HBZ62915.1 rod shape-determining protein [Acidimicrobium sp.]